MYSAVLMLALTAGSETADFGRNRCNGCTTRCSVVSSCSYYTGCASSCHGRGGLFGNRGHGCSSSYGCHGGGLFRRGGHGCHGCSSSYGCQGCSVSYGCCSSGTIVVPETKMMPKEGEKVPPPKKTTSLSAPATIVVSLPADARLIVDGTSTKSTSDRRTLVTPELEFGWTYVYTMRAEVVRDGRSLVETQDVTVRGGETSTVQFQFSNQTVATR